MDPIVITLRSDKTPAFPDPAGALTVAENDGNLTNLKVAIEQVDAETVKTADFVPVTLRATEVQNTDDFLLVRAGVMRLVSATVMAEYFGSEVVATAPAALTALQWASEPTATPGQISFNIIALPADGGSPITALEYRVGTGSAIAFTGTGTGVRVVTAGLTGGTPADLQVRAVNAVGEGAWSDVKNRTPLASGGSVTYVGAGTIYSTFSALTSHPVAVPAGMAAGDTLIIRTGNNGVDLITGMTTNEGQSLTSRVSQSQTGAIWSVVLSGTVPTSVNVAMSAANEFRAQAIACRGAPQFVGFSSEDVIAEARDSIQYTADGTSNFVVVGYRRVTESVTAALFNGSDAANVLSKFDFDDGGLIAGIHDGPTGVNDIDLTWSATDTGGRYLTAVFKP